MESMKKVALSNYSITILSIFISIALMSTQRKDVNATYSPIKIVSNYPSSINEWTHQDKIDAFEYVSLTGDCAFKGIKLQGKVKFVTSFPDACGKWQVVESFPDFTVQIVTSFPDLKVQQVESFPGMN
jgi:hypothetical protein